MKPPKKANSPILPTSSDDSTDVLRGSREKRSGKRARGDAKRGSSGIKRRLRRNNRTDRSSGIRETEEARRLLESQLHSLYWWVFNASKMKGFIRARGLNESIRANVSDGKTQTERQGFDGSPILREKQAP
jgi:hypothetical protein